MGKSLKEKLLGVGGVKVHDLGVVKLVWWWGGARNIRKVYIKEKMTFKTAYVGRIFKSRLWSRVTENKAPGSGERCWTWWWEGTYHLLSLPCCGVRPSLYKCWKHMCSELLMCGGMLWEPWEFLSVTSVSSRVFFLNLSII